MAKSKNRRRPPGGRKKKGELTAKQRRFVQEYLVDGNATRAAGAAGFSRRTAADQGGQLLKKPRVAEAIAAGQAKIAGDLRITAETVRKMMLEDRDKAIALEQMPAAVKSTENLGRSLPGFFVDRREHGGIGGGPIPIAAAAMTPEQLAKLTDKQLDQLEEISRTVLPEDAGDAGGTQTGA